TGTATRTTTTAPTRSTRTRRRSTSRSAAPQRSSPTAASSICARARWSGSGLTSCARSPRAQTGSASSRSAAHPAPSAPGNGPSSVPTRPVRPPGSVPQAMDEQAFALLIEPHRRALHLHCYRMLGSLHDADDAVQETMLRAWKSSDSYEPRAQLTTWLHAIATNVCLTAIARRRKRPAELIADLENLQPFPARLLDDLVERETVELAFIAAIQLLSPKQRAVLILRDVLGWSAKATAEAPEDSVPAVNSALQCARVGLEGTRRQVPAPSERERALVKQFMTAWDAVDID